MDDELMSRIESDKRVKLLFKNPYTGAEKVVMARSVYSKKLSGQENYYLSLTSRQVMASLQAIGLSIDIDEIKTSIKNAIPIPDGFPAWRFCDLDHCNPPTKKHHLKVELSRKLRQGEFL
jgi:hypothetical protein